MSSNQATYTAIFEASNQIEVVRACLKADIEVSPDKAIENDGMRIILESIVESLAKHIEVLMDEESAEKEVNKVKAKPAIKDKQAVKELNADEQHACSMLDQICTLSNAVIGQARDSVQLCSSEEEQTANTFISIATMVSNIGWMADLSMARINGTNNPSVVGTAEDWCSPHPQRYDYLNNLAARN